MNKQSSFDSNLKSYDNLPSVIGDYMWYGTHQKSAWISQTDPFLDLIKCNLK